MNFGPPTPAWGLETERVFLICILYVDPAYTESGWHVVNKLMGLLGFQSGLTDGKLAEKWEALKNDIENKVMQRGLSQGRMLPFIPQPSEHFRGPIVRRYSSGQADKKFAEPGPSNSGAGPKRTRAAYPNARPRQPGQAQSAPANMNTLTPIFSGFTAWLPPPELPGRAPAAKTGFYPQIVPATSSQIHHGRASQQARAAANKGGPSQDTDSVLANADNMGLLPSVRYVPPDNTLCQTRRPSQNIGIIPIGLEPGSSIPNPPATAGQTTAAGTREKGQLATSVPARQNSERCIRRVVPYCDLATSFRGTSTGSPISQRQRSAPPGSPSLYGPISPCAQGVSAS